MHDILYDFDTILTQFVQSFPDWTAPFMHIATFLGQPLITIPLVIGIIAYGLYRKNKRLAIAGVVAGATFALNSLLKLLIQRDRPETADFLAVHSFSFPSGHASSTVVIFGLLAVILWQVLPRVWARVVVGALVLLVVAVGISRVYLGAHYPSDVVAGWVVGGLGLATILCIVRPRL